MSRFTSPINTLLPQSTAMRLLRIMLFVTLIPAVAGVVTLWSRLGADYALATLLIVGPIGAAWLFVMVPGLDRRLGRRYLPIALVVTIAAQTLESGLVSFTTPPFEFRLRPFNVARLGFPLDLRFVEPLFLL
ncbi:MAG TPA: hypothetical protein VFF59_02825, partial [Anaerolineae bacterium]|nr:hypothetical protein [Anaerolineae bacterium]